MMRGNACGDPRIINAKMQSGSKPHIKCLKAVILMQPKGIQRRHRTQKKGTKSTLLLAAFGCFWLPDATVSVATPYIDVPVALKCIAHVSPFHPPANLMVPIETHAWSSSVAPPILPEGLEYEAALSPFATAAALAA